MSELIYAVIPARGGSKGVPRKNVRSLGGYPLIAWSVAAARLCASVTRTFVSTDSDDIAAVAATYGAEVPFLRPAALSQDRSTDREFVMHALDWFREYEGREPDFLVHVRPTTPLRDAAKLDEAIRMMLDNATATGLRSVHPLAEPPHKMLRIVEGYLTGFFPDDPRPEYYNLPRQSFPTAYNPNGYVDVLRTSFVRSGESLHGTRMLAYVTPHAIEVDRPEDFEQLEFQLGREPSAVHAFLKANYPPVEI